MRADRRIDNSPSTGQEAPEYWSRIARQWRHIGPPLRPAGQDLAFLRTEIDAWSRSRGSPRVLILGVTPEFYHLPWPTGTQLLAVDHTRAMIEAVWPGPRDAAVCAEWNDLPLPPSSRDIVLCDGGIHLVNGLHAQGAMVEGLRRLVAPGGICLLRLFVPPRQRETPRRVLDDLLAGRIANTNLLKFRLWMALHEDPAEGVQLSQVWDAIEGVDSDLARLATRIGWDHEKLLAMANYRDCPTRYFFPTLADVRRLFCDAPGGFDLQTSHVPTYELGEQCPTVVLHRHHTT